MQNREADLVRIVFDLGEDQWHGSVTERLWAEPIDNHRFRLRNTPFYALGVSMGDVVFAEERSGELFYAGVSIRGGHSSYRIMVLPETSEEAFLRYWRPVGELGCSWEQGPGEQYRIYAVDVPPQADIYEVYRLLEEGATRGIWDFDEAHCEHSQ